jgi:hypothetical protein
MKRNLTILYMGIFVSLLLSSIGIAKPWEKSLDLNLNATQSSYSDSWVGGEAGNVTWASNANGIFTKQLSPIFTLKNTVSLAFGQTVTQDKEDKSWSKPSKSTDKIDLEALGLFNIKSYIEPYGAFRLESQFLDASVDTNKRYINPLLLTVSGGIARQLLEKDKNDILTRLGLAIKHNINRDVYVYRVNGTDTTIKSETVSETDGGIESVTEARLVLSDKLGYLGRLSLYKALYYSEKDKVKGTEQENFWKAIDIDWENTITASITKYVQVSLYAQLLYDKQISKKGRFKETLALGLTYKLL